MTWRSVSVSVVNDISIAKIHLEDKEDWRLARKAVFNDGEVHPSVFAFSILINDL